MELEFAEEVGTDGASRTWTRKRDGNVNGRIDLADPKAIGEYEKIGALGQSRSASPPSRNRKNQGAVDRRWP
jgi:hypothetical protein